MRQTEALREENKLLKEEQVTTLRRDISEAQDTIIGYITGQRTPQKHKEEEETLEKGTGSGSGREAHFEQSVGSQSEQYNYQKYQ